MGTSLLLSSRATYFLDTQPQYFSGTPQEFYLSNIASRSIASQSDGMSSEAAKTIDGQYAECAQSTEGGNDWLTLDFENNVNFDSVSIYGSHTSPDKSSNLDVSICNADESVCKLCKTQVDVGARTKEPAVRILCNVNGQIVKIEKSSEMQICEVEIYSLDSLQHVEIIQTRNEKLTPDNLQIFESYSDLDTLYKNADDLFQFTLRYPEMQGINYNVWHQNSLPSSDTVVGYNSIFTPFTMNGWNGLKTEQQEILHNQEFNKLGNNVRQAPKVIQEVNTI